MTLIGIDPGASTGVAVFRSGSLCNLMTWAPHEIPAELACFWPDRVIFEDSRLISPVWSRSTTQAARVKIARNVGQVDAVCSLIVSVCSELGIPARGISPRAKGAKLTAEQFERVTGWSARCNQHERDAAMTAWPHRRLSA